MEGLSHDVESPAQENIMQTPADGISQSTTSTKAKPKPTARKLVMDAIRHLKDPKGSSFAEIRKFLASKPELVDAADSKTLKTFMVDALERGILAIEDGKYKIKETARKKQSESKTTTRRRRSDGKKSATRKGKNGSPKRKTRSKKRSSKQKIKKSSPTRKRRSTKKSTA